MKIKGTVLEINSDTALVMTSECDFMEIYRHEGLETGQEIVFSRRDVVRKGKRTKWTTLALVASLILFFICAPFYFSFFTGTAGATVAYVSLDINPSLELAVNNRCQVTKTTAFNEDGDKLLQNVPVNGKPVTEAVAALIKAAEEMHYLNTNTNDLVLVCISPAGNKDQNTELASSISNELAAFEKPEAVKLKIVDVSNIQRQEAQQIGMSAGRYNLWKEAGNSNNDNLEQYKKGKLTDFIAESQGNGNINGKGVKPGNGLNAVVQNQKQESRQGTDQTNSPGLEKKESTISKYDELSLERKNNTPKNQEQEYRQDAEQDPPGLKKKETPTSEYKDISLERRVKPQKIKSTGRSNPSGHDTGVSSGKQGKLNHENGSVDNKE